MKIATLRDCEIIGINSVTYYAKLRFFIFSENCAELEKCGYW